MQTVHSVTLFSLQLGQNVEVTNAHESISQDVSTQVKKQAITREVEVINDYTISFLFYRRFTGFVRGFLLNRLCFQ